MSEQKTYFPCSSVKQVTFERSGKTILKIGLRAQEAIDFIKQHTNERGYINLGISERREPGKHGDTHCMWLDTWQPQRAEGEQAKQGFDAMRKAAGPTPNPNAKIDKDDVPF